MFDDDAIVDNNGREFRGGPPSRHGATAKSSVPRSPLKVIEVTERDGATIVTTEVDGTFDRTGIRDPVVIDHHIAAGGVRIVRLTCRLASK